MRWWRRNRAENEQPDTALGWFESGGVVEPELSEPQRRLLIAARARLNWIAPSRARAWESWASFEPTYTLGGALWLCVPIVEARHDSLQLGIWDETIVGGWQHRHYAWDYPKGERFRVSIRPDTVDASITEALDWLEGEMRNRDLV